MWVEKLTNGKFKFSERYTDPYTEKYRRVSVTLNSKSNQAQKQASKLLNQKIEDKIGKRTPDKNLRFEDALLEWLKYHKKTVKESTHSMICGMLDTVAKYIHPDTLVKNIDSNMLRNIVEKAYYEDKYSINYVKNIKAIITAVLKRSYEMGYISAVPNYRINVKLRNEIHYEKYLEKKELRMLIDALNSKPMNARKADMVEFMALTGLRYGELIAITEDKINGNMLTVDGTIDFRSQGYSSPVRTTPKTKKSNRIITLSKRCIEILEKVKAENDIMKLSKRYVDHGYIFTSIKGLPIDYRSFSPILKKYATKSGIKKPVTSHYLRHTHVSMLAELNVDIKTVMDRIGHSDASTTLEIYSHVTDKMKKTVADKLDTIEL